MARPRISDNRRWLLDATGKILLGAFPGQWDISGANNPGGGGLDEHTCGVRNPSGTDFMKAPWWNVYPGQQANGTAHDANIAAEFERCSQRLMGFYLDKGDWPVSWNLATGEPTLPSNTQARVHELLALAFQYDFYLVFTGNFSMLVFRGWNETGCSFWKWSALSTDDGDPECGGPGLVPIGPFPEPPHVINSYPDPAGTLYQKANYLLMEKVLEMLMASPHADRVLGVVYDGGETETLYGPTGGASVDEWHAWDHFMAVSQAHKAICYAHRATPGWWRVLRPGGTINDGEPGILDLSFYCESVGSQPGGPPSWVDAEFAANGPQVVGITNYEGPSLRYNTPADLFDLSLGPNGPSGTGRLERAYNLGKLLPDLDPTHRPVAAPAYQACGTLVSSPFLQMSCFRRNPPSAYASPSAPYDGRYGWQCRWYEGAFDQTPTASGCAYPGGPPGACLPYPDESTIRAVAAAEVAAGRPVGEVNCPATLHMSADPGCTAYAPRTNALLGALARVYFLAPYIDGACTVHQWSSNQWTGDGILGASVVGRQLAELLTTRNAHGVQTDHKRIHADIELVSGQGDSARKTGSWFDVDASHRFGVIYWCRNEAYSTEVQWRLWGLPHAGPWYWRAYTCEGTLLATQSGQATAVNTGDGWCASFDGSSRLQWATLDCLIIVQSYAFDAQTDVLPPVPSNPAPAPGATNVATSAGVSISWTDAGGNGINSSTWRLFHTPPGSTESEEIDWTHPDVTRETIAGGTRFTYTPVGGLAVGLHWFYSTCRDPAGNYAEYGIGTWSFTVGGGTAPSFSAPFPLPNATAVAPDARLEITVSSPDDINLATFKVRLDGGAWVSPPDIDGIVAGESYRGYYDPPGLLAEGSHTVSWTAENGLGDPNTYGPYTFTVGTESENDILAPVCVDVTPNEGANIPPTTTFSSVWYDQALPGNPSSGIDLSTIKLRFDSGAWHVAGEFSVTQLSGGQVRFTYLGPDGCTTAGPHTVEWRLSDNEVNEGVKVYQVTVDSSSFAPPALSNFRVVSIHYATEVSANVTLGWDPYAAGVADGILLLQRSVSQATYLPGLTLLTLPAAGAPAGDCVCVANNIDPTMGGYAVLNVPVGFRYYWYAAAWNLS